MVAREYITAESPPLCGACPLVRLSGVVYLINDIPRINN